MRNLAGHPEADHYIRAELTQAGAECVEHPANVPRSEVPTRVTGRLGSFELRRLWYYWSVTGRVPLPVAEELYANPIGQRDVRVAGHCACPPPREWATRAGAEAFVESYHIDTQEGLNLFCETLRRHGLVGGGKR